MSKKELDRYKVRLQSTDLTQKTPNYRHSARVFIHAADFHTSGFSSGGLCIVETGPLRREAVTWLQRDKNIGKGIVTVSRAFQRAAGLTLEDVIRVTPVPGGSDVPDAGAIVARPVSGDISSLAGRELERWEFELERRLEIAIEVFPGLLLEDLTLNGTTFSFIVDSVNGSSSNVAKYTPSSTRVTIVAKHASKQPETTAKLEVRGIPGMHNQLESLNNDFLRFFEVDLSNIPDVLGSCGVVVHGSRGTGKSLLLNRLADTNWGTIVRIEDQEMKSSMVAEQFQAAGERQTPTMILIDNISEMIGENRTSRLSYIKAIGQGLDSLAAKALKQGRRPKVVVVATCLDYFNDIPDDLRRHTRFRRHIAIPIPDAAARKDIIRSWKPWFPPESSEQYISDLGDRTHAYSPDDLHKVYEQATLGRFRRVKDLSSEEPISWDDIAHALKEVRPTAMHDINLKPPTVHWSDIGGYDNVKTALQRVMRSPPTDPNKPLFVPPKGILLYGPPGCSKTMTAQAMATESSFNFFAVKGGELLNMYVGETERSIRNLFRRAQEASPSIVFFDEIDSIAGSRTPQGSSGGGVQALTTLLTEMAGFERKGDVFVLAATNKPDALDPALLRPGRFDQLIYVPLPDHGARRTILAAKARELRFPVADMDLDALARELDGYSGAEVASICDRAFMGVGFDVGADGGAGAGAGGDGAGDGDGDGDGDGQVDIDAMQVLRDAIRGTPKLVTWEMLDHFANWHHSVRK